MNIYDDVADQITMYRHETRAAPMLDLTALILEFGYDVAMTEIYANPLPDQNDETIRYEMLVNHCAVALAAKLGVAVNPQVSFNKPREMVRIIQGLTSAFEEFEDMDTLYGIVLSGEPPMFVLENMIRYVYGDDNLHMEDLIVNVEPRVMTVMRNFLSAASLDAQAGDTDPRTARIAQYLRVFPQNPSAWTFMNLPPQVDLTTLVKSLDFEEDNGVAPDELLLVYSVGMSVAVADNFDAAYAQLERSLELINNEGISPLPILQHGVEALRTIYPSETESDEQD